MAERVEARTVTGAIPRFFATVPAHDTSQMRANSRKFVQSSVFVAVGGELVFGCLECLFGLCERPCRRGCLCEGSVRAKRREELVLHIWI